MRRVSVALRASPRGATGGLLGEEEATGTCATQGLVDPQPSFTTAWFLAATGWLNNGLS